MRVLFVAGKAWPGLGGVESLTHYVARSMADRHDVEVLALRNDDGTATRLSGSLRLPPPFSPYEDGPVAYRPLELSLLQKTALLPQALQVVPVARRYAYTSIRRLYAANYAAVVGAEIARHAGDADVIHTWTTDLLAAAGVRAARITGAAAVITPFLHVGQWGADSTSVHTYQQADRVVGLLNAERNSLIELGVPAEKVSICGACTPKIDLNGTRSVRERHGVEGPVVLFVGARRSYKGVDVLLEAAPRVAAEIPGVTFAFVGPGDPIAVPDGVDVIDAGKVDTDELGAWMKEADLLCLPSAHEILPTSILEAWSHGTPSLTSDIETLRELMERSGGGDVAPRDPAKLARRMIAMLADPVALREKGVRGRKFWEENYTPPAVAEGYERIYQELTGQGENSGTSHVDQS